MIEKAAIFLTSVVGSGLLSQTPLTESFFPQTLSGAIGWGVAIAMVIIKIMDARKVSAADASQAVIAEKEKIIASHETMITHLEKSVEDWKEQATKFQDEFQKLRDVSHAFRNYAGSLQNLCLLNNVPLPEKPEILKEPTS